MQWLSELAWSRSAVDPSVSRLVRTTGARSLPSAVYRSRHDILLSYIISQSFTVITHDMSSSVLSFSHSSHFFRISFLSFYRPPPFYFFFFFNNPAPPEFYPFPLPDPFPI